MKVIKVGKTGLMADFQIWAVQPEYVELFLSKCKDKGNEIELPSFFFNDTVDVTNPHQWLTASAALWCRIYREAETVLEQAEALGGVRAVYFLAGSLGHGAITTAISAWWNMAFELHQLPAVNYSAVSRCPRVSPSCKPYKH